MVEMNRLKSLLIVGVLAMAGSAMSFAQASLQVEPAKLDGPRVLQPQTAQAVVKDYLDSWQSMRTALEQNRPDALDRDFVGAAHDKLAETIQQQAKAGLRTSYQDRSHDVQITFYSPEGLSVELVDNVEYDVQILDHDKLQTTQHVRARYIAVLTPTEVRWRVRVLQAQPE